MQTVPCAPQHVGKGDQLLSAPCPHLVHGRVCVPSPRPTSTAPWRPHSLLRASPVCPLPGPTSLPPCQASFSPSSVTCSLSVCLSPSQSLCVSISVSSSLSLPPPFGSGILFIAKAMLQQRYRKCLKEKSLLPTSRAMHSSSGTLSSHCVHIFHADPSSSPALSPSSR